MYVDTDHDGKIIQMEKGLEKGNILLGHSFWKRNFLIHLYPLLKKTEVVESIMLFFGNGLYEII